MILVDTSVWIRFLANQAPYAQRMDALLARDDVTGHQLIYGELLIGDPGGRAKLLSRYEKMSQTSMVRHEDVVAFTRFRKLHGRGIGRIDVHLLASAIVDDLQLWTADERFAAVARELGVSWESPSLKLL